MNETSKIERPKRKSVRRPASEDYLGSAVADQLTRMILELLSELWIMRDRQLVTEELLESKGLLPIAEIEGYSPAEAATERFEQIRTQLVENVLTAPYRHEVSVEALAQRGRTRLRANERR